MGLKSGIIVPFQYKNIKKLLMIGGTAEDRDLTLSDFKTAVWAAFGVYEFEFRNKKIDFHIPDQLLLHYLKQKGDITNFVIEIAQVLGDTAAPQLQSHQVLDPNPVPPAPVVIREVIPQEIEIVAETTVQSNAAPPPVPSSSTKDIAPSMNLRKRRRVYTTRGPQIDYASVTSDMDSSDARFESIFETFDGKIVMNNFRRCQRLQEEDRRILSRLVVSKELENSELLKITRERLVELSHLICRKFSSEIPEIYFVPYSPITKKVARGKLWECYNNLKRRSKNSIRRHTIFEDAEPLSDREDIEFLLQKDAPWSEIVEKWDESFDHRRKEVSVNNGGSALAYFSKYPALQLVNGYELLERDFDQLYPGKSGQLLDKWNSICEKIVAVAVARYKNSIAQILDEYDTDMEMCALMLMPYILQINKRHHSEFGRSNPENIITHIVDVDPDTKFVEQLVQEAEDDELEPRVVVIGPLDGDKSSYMIMHKTIYFLESPIKAVDLCFKIYHALNLMYPIKQDQSWLLLQRVGYGIVTERDAPNTTLSSFLADVFN